MMGIKEAFLEWFIIVLIKNLLLHVQTYLLLTQEKEVMHKACFQHNMAYRDFKDLPVRAASHKVLCDKAFNIVKIW